MDTHACPVCASPYAVEDGAAFALHVVDCTTSSSSSPPVSSSFQAVVENGVARATAASSKVQVPSCELCHHVYASGTAEHVVEFHDFECSRVHKRKGKAASTSSKASSKSSSCKEAKLQGKRPREPVTTSAVTTAPASTSKRASVGAASPVSTLEVNMETTPVVEKKATLFPSQCALCGAVGRALLHCAGS
ncbi:hypothetical protein Gpo141_00010883, partial [Globisporangium polare]